MVPTRRRSARDFSLLVCGVLLGIIAGAAIIVYQSMRISMDELGEASAATRQHTQQLEPTAARH